MNTPESITPKTNNFFYLIYKNWENLEEPQKVLLKKNLECCYL